MSRIATIGFFDGVHRGHQFLFEHLRKTADERGLVPLIVSFTNHPRIVLQEDYMPQLLTTPHEREVLLSRYGEVAMLSFEEVQPLSAKQFMLRLQAEYDVSVLLMGYDHSFGSDRLKRPQEYRRIGEAIGMEVITLSEYTEGEWHVSSTEIRTALECGNIALANELLGRPYSLSGTVVHGKAIGRTIGFSSESSTRPMRNEAPAFVNIDPNRLIEVHIPSFKGDLYDHQLEIKFLRFIREEKCFEHLEELKSQIKADVDSILRPDAGMPG